MPGLETIEANCSHSQRRSSVAQLWAWPAVTHHTSDPGYEPFRLWHELQSTLGQPSGCVCDALKYLDHAGADQ